MSDRDPQRMAVVPRDRTTEGLELITWMLGNGEADRAELYLEQLERATVGGLWPCGCASLELLIDGTSAPDRVQILGDFVFGDETDMSGIFVFGSGGQLGASRCTDLRGTRRGSCRKLRSYANSLSSCDKYGRPPRFN